MDKVRAETVRSPEKDRSVEVSIPVDKVRARFPSLKEEATPSVSIPVDKVRAPSSGRS